VQYGSDLSVGLCRYATSGGRGWQDPYGPFLYGFGATLPGQRHHDGTLWLVERGSRWHRDELHKEIVVLLDLELGLTRRVLRFLIHNKSLLPKNYWCRVTSIYLRLSCYRSR